MDLKIKAKYVGNGSVYLYLRSGVSNPAVFCSFEENSDNCIDDSTGTNQMLDQYVDAINDAFGDAGLLENGNLLGGINQNMAIYG